MTISVNSSISCNWPTAAAVVGDIKAGSLNVTDIVAQCANVCQIVFKSSNPAGDIVGEGVMISSLCQLALACIFGALLPGIIWLTSVRRWETLIRGIPLLRKFQKSVYGINAFVSISLLVAAIVRRLHAPPVMEKVFLYHLVNAQLLIVMSMLFAQFSDYTMNSSHLGSGWIIYYVVIGFAQLGTSFALELPDHHVYYKLANECHIQHQFIDVTFDLTDFLTATTTVKWWGVGVIFTLACAFLIAIISQFCSWKKVLSVIPVWLKTHGSFICLVLILQLYVVAIILNAISVGRIRDLVKKTSGDLLQEIEWGYGQTTAILLWLPFFWAALEETTNYWRELHQAEKTAKESSTLEQRKPLLQGLEAELPPYSTHNSPLLGAGLPGTH